MDKNQDLYKSQQKKFILWVAVVYLILIIIVVVFNYRLLSLSTNIQDKKSQIQAIKNRENNINQLQDKYYQIANDIDIVSATLPNEENIADFVKYLENLSISNNVALEILFDDKSNQDVVKNNYLIFNLSVSGPGKNVGDFWKSLENSAYFVNINNFNFNSTNGLNSDTKLSLKAKVYTNAPYRSDK
jgi:Tfp pilus assembly protein PilO